MKVAILFGGQSTENYISRLSASSVINTLDKDRYDIVKIGITKDGKWYNYTGDTDKIDTDEWVEYIEINKDTNKPVNGLEILAGKDIDVIFPVLHGTNGEDGTIQGLMELLGKPYVGCGVLASAVSMDKAYTKIICEKEGIPQCRYDVFQRYEIQADIEKCIDKAEKHLGYPCFVKPSNAGSSFGVSKASDRKELKGAILNAARYDIRVIVEEFVNGREIECAVLGNYDAEAAVPGEVIAANEFYDYQAKYFNNKSRTEVPADITPEQAQEVKDYAIRVFKCLDGRGLARVDFFLDRDTGKFIFNEINTLPGFTDISMYSKMWNASGLPYEGLLNKLIELAFENHEMQKRNYE